MSHAVPARNDHVAEIRVTGPLTAGTTNSISVNSATPVVDTDVATTGDQASIRGRTTVAMDFGTDRVDDANSRGLLSGTPGQERFGVMTDVMKGDVDAIISIVDGTDEATHARAGKAMRALQHDLHIPLVVAVNRCDDQRRADEIARRLGALASEAAVPCQPIRSDDRRDVIVVALVTALDRLERGDAARWRTPLQCVIDAVACPRSEAA